MKTSYVLKYITKQQIEYMSNLYHDIISTLDHRPSALDPILESRFNMRCDTDCATIIFYLVRLVIIKCPNF